MVNGIIITVAVSVIALSISAATDIDATDIDKDSKSRACANLTSCSSCLDKSFCTWCVTKSKCTNHSCGNDNVIYSKNVRALMSGSQFCPKIVTPEKEVIFESGKKQIIVVKITQIYLYMAFTAWKCRINLDGNEKVVNAVLLSDEVYCDSAELINDSDKMYAEGDVAVMWEHSKTFDGVLPFKVCRCDLNANCAACNA